MKIKHSKKVKMARKMLASDERGTSLGISGKKIRTALFESSAWEARKKAILARVNKKIKIAKEKALARKEAKKLLQK